METSTPSTTSPSSVRNWNDNSHRVKMLCSFNGSVLPRPQDGKLRYVGGETRILSVPRHIGFEDLMTKMKELFQGVTVLKYKQPDEDLDALVSLVNDDDVINMMEEYDELGSWLRVFLFSNSELDDPLHFIDSLNHSLNDSPEFGKQPMSEFQGIPPPMAMDDLQFTENYFNQMSFETNIHYPMSPGHMHQLTIPNLGSLHHQQQALTQSRYNEMEPPRSPVYYSPSSPSPSCSYYHNPYNEPTDRVQTPFYNPYHPPPYSRNQTPDFQNSFYLRDSNDPRPYYNETHLDERSWMPYPYNTRNRHEFGNEFVNDQPRYGNNFPYAYGNENLHHGHIPANPNSLCRDVQSPMHGYPLNENDATSPRVRIEVENQNQYQNQNQNQNQNPLVDGGDIPDYYHVRPVKLIPDSYNLKNQQRTKPNDSSPPLVNDRDLSPNTMNKQVNENKPSTKTEPNAEVNISNSDPHTPQKNTMLNESDKTPNSNSPEKQDAKTDEHLSILPGFVESVKKAALECDEEVKDEATKVNESSTENPSEVKEETTHELDVVDAPEDLELDSDTGTENNSKIERTKAEEEAIARGLQTIKNDDLEEVKVLGSGTYGAVYHGKWKGSDVAIKRIKASCFSGKPSERERMIADFWKEALMLSSLHHPNVVSFYGIVRDGPDGSLATVTEYMINGSLKQFLKKKDRTIDRRKRLIIAMDIAFGMEYLHGKNIVHFDLKCENLLVNMRDPHRPICKIGDFGLSKVKQQTMVSGGVRGTLPWMAPELLSGKCHMVNEKIDVYSFGVVMWELLTGDEPYANMHCASIIGGIVNNTLRPTIPTWCDPGWKSLMESCWAGEPLERPSFLEVSQKLRTMATAINVK